MQHTKKGLALSMSKGFTLIELLIVIGILAVLATITVLVLNPAQLFAQARDSQRLSDLGSIKGAIALYLTTKSAPDLGSDTGGGFQCSDDTTVANRRYAASIDGTTSPFVVSTIDEPTHSGEFATTGAGWVAVNLGDTTGGSPLPAIPRDPNNDATYFYAYACDNTAKTFELDANMESTRYACGGDDDVESTDGGDKNGGVACASPTTAFYETGTDPALNL